jgi:hypothetical protein
MLNSAGLFSMVGRWGAEPPLPGPIAADGPFNIPAGSGKAKSLSNTDVQSAFTENPSS